MSTPATATHGLSAPAGELVFDYLAEQVDTLREHEPGVRTDAPDAVHKSRVAARRLRSALRAFGPLLDADGVGPLVGELRWYGEIAGAPRDAEVLKEHLLAALDELDASAVHGPVARRLVADLDAHHADAHARLVESLDGHRYARLVRALDALVDERPVTVSGRRPARAVLPGLLDAASDRVRRRYDKALRRPGKLVRWHEVRKAAKAVRYCCDALVPAGGEPAEASAKLWEAVTEAFGDLQDSVVAHEVFGEFEARAAERGEPTDTYDVLRRRQLVKRFSALASGIEALDAALADPLDWLR